LSENRFKETFAASKELVKCWQTKFASNVSCTLSKNGKTSSKIGYPGVAEILRDLFIYFYYFFLLFPRYAAAHEMPMS
jgi:hypothetical protein